MSNGERKPVFTDLRRQQFRRYFQPSRIVLCLLEDLENSRINAITLCFVMYCSYQPPMLSFAIQRGSRSYSLIQTAPECVIAVPGESLADEVMYMGTVSGAERDKIRDSDLELAASSTVRVPGLSRAIANLEMEIVARVPTGDHVTVVGRVRRFGVDLDNRERCLISVGPNTDGYEILAHKGVHRVAVVADAAPLR